MERPSLEELREQVDAPDSTSGAAWPEISSVADLGRILVVLHGASAPSEAMLKKWSAAGEFRDCMLSVSQRPQPDEGSPRPESRPRARPMNAPSAKPGRPGLQLVTGAAIARIYELWPQLAESNSEAIFEEAVARTARQLSAAIRPLGQSIAPDTGGAAAADEWKERIEQTLAGLSLDLKELRREMAQFTAMRNNLVTRLDEVIIRARETAGPGRADGGGADPIVEARRERDMRALKSAVDQIAATLDRLEGKQIK